MNIRVLSEKVLRNLTPLSTSHLCEFEFTADTVIKSKYRTKINVVKEMRVAVSSLILRFKKICSHFKANPSHYIY